MSASAGASQPRGLEVVKTSASVSAASASTTASADPIRTDPIHREVVEFGRGAFAAILNVILTYPLNKLISRQAYEGLGASAAARTVMNDVAAGTLYRGVGMPLTQRALASGAMFASYDFWARTLMGGADLDCLPTRVRVAAAFLAGSSEWVLTPFERAQTLLTHRKHDTRFPFPRDAVRAMAKKGIREFYRGGSAILVRNGPANALYFSLREPLADWLKEAAGGGEGEWEVLATNFTSGALLGAGISTLLYPLHTCKVVMQLELGGRHMGVWDTGKRLVRERGGIASGLYRGVYLNSIRSLVSWGIVNAAYEATRGYSLKA